MSKKKPIQAVADVQAASTVPSQGGPAKRSATALSVRVRFEIFKRDKFTCRYCGRTSPGVILEVDHIVPRANGGTNDPMNLTTSCFECNSGKSDKNLSEIITGEDPHDKAIEMLERERQLKEYDQVMAAVSDRIEQDVEWLQDQLGLYHYAEKFKTALRIHSKHDVLEAWRIARRIDGGAVAMIQYAYGILRNWEKRRGISKS